MILVVDMFVVDICSNLDILDWIKCVKNRYFHFSPRTKGKRFWNLERVLDVLLVI